MACKAARGALGRRRGQGGDRKLPGTQACAGQGRTHLRYLPNGAPSGAHPAAQPAPQGGWLFLIGSGGCWELPAGGLGLSGSRSSQMTIPAAASEEVGGARPMGSLVH